MDTFGWAGGCQHDDVHMPRLMGQLSCGRFDLDDAFMLSACFGQLQHGVDGDPDAEDDGVRQVSSTLGAVGGAAPGLASDPMSFDVLASAVDGAGAHDGLLDTALASFSREMACGEGDGGTVSNGAMFSCYSGTNGGNISSGESNNYSGGGHDANEVASPTSTISPTTTTSLTQALHHQPKLADDYPVTIATVLPAAPLPRPGAKRKATTTTTSITFGQGASHDSTAGAAGGYEPDMETMAQVKEMIYRAAAMRPVNLSTEPPPADNKPRRKNVRISSDPQTVAARLRRERVSERLRVLQKLVPGGSKLDTASMLDEAASYLRFLKSHVQALETLGGESNTTAAIATATSRPSSLQQHYYSNNPGFPGFVRNNNNISVFANPNGSATKLL